MARNGVTVTVDVEYEHELTDGWTEQKRGSLTRHYTWDELDTWLKAYTVKTAPDFMKHVVGGEVRSHPDSRGWISEIEDGVWVVEGESFEVDINATPMQLLRDVGSMKGLWGCVYSGRDNGAAKRALWTVMQHNDMAEQIRDLELPADDDEIAAAMI